MLRVFNKSNRLFQLESAGDKMLVAPRKVLSLEERFAEDITYRMAVAAGDIEVLAGGGVGTADAEEITLQAENEKPLEPIQHPDSMEETEAKRKQAAATGKVTRAKKKD